MRPRRIALPDLSTLDDALTANYILSLTFGRGFPPGDAHHLVTALVRSTEGALHRYEEARLQLEASVGRESLIAYLHGVTGMELTFMALHRTMRLAEALMRSPETRVGTNELPSQPDRHLLRVMRNAIEHTDEPIVDGRAGKGHTLALHVQEDHSSIDDDAGTHAVSHAHFAGWVSTLHALAVNLTNLPHSYATSARGSGN